MLGVPYKGSAPAVSDTIGGQTQFMFPSLYTALPHVKAGKLRALAVAGPNRSALLPDVPTLKEAGVDGVDVQQWYGFFAPAKTPAAIVQRLNAEINAALALALPATRERMQAVGAEPVGGTPQKLAELVDSEIERWTRTIKPVMRAK